MRTRLAIALATILGLAACGEADRLVVFLTASPNVTEDPLDPAVVGWLRIRVEGPGMGVVTAEGPFTRGGTTTVPEVPAGPDRRLVVEGFTGDGGLLVSRGESLPFTLAPGENEVELYLGLVERFSAAAGQGFEPPRLSAAVGRDLDGTVVVSGGATGGDATAPADAIGRVERFDPTSGRLAGDVACDGDPGCAAAARWGHVVVATEDGLLLLGGADDAGPVTALGRCEAGACVQGVTVPFPRLGGIAVDDPLGGAWILGGHDGAEAVRRLDRIDGAANLVAGAGELPASPVGLAAAMDAGGALLVFGLADGRPRIGDVTGSETVFTALTGVADRRHAALVALEDGRILVVGGRDPDGLPVSEIALWDGATGRLCPVGGLLRPRWRHAAARLRDGRVLVSGGLIGAGAVTAEAEILDPRHLPAGGSCERVASRLDVHVAARMLVPRHDHTLVPLDNGAVLVVGGVDDRGRPPASLDLFVPGR